MTAFPSVLVAVLTNDGAPISDPAVATYTAPGPLTPGRAGHLKVTAAKRAFTYSYTPPANATRVRVMLVTSDGRHLERMVSAKLRHGTLPTLGAPDTLTVTVTGIAANGRHGRPATAKAGLRAAKPRKRGK